MNRWTCQQTHCDETVIGVGSAIGLRAIGWDVEIASRSAVLLPPLIRCPAHHRDPGIEVCSPEALCRPCRYATAMQVYIEQYTVKPEVIRKSLTRAAANRWRCSTCEQERDCYEEDKDNGTTVLCCNFCSRIIKTWPTTV